jgi:hypothetical protein
MRDQGIVYEMNWQPVRWQAELAVKTKADANLALGNHNGIKYRWDRDNLILQWPSRGLMNSWSSGREAFANGILAHLPEIPETIRGSQNIYCTETNRVYWGNGDLLSSAEIHAMIQAHHKAAQPLYMKEDLMVVIDNTRIMHGRTSSSRDVGHHLLCRFGMLDHRLVRGHGPS